MVKRFKHMRMVWLTTAAVGLWGLLGGCAGRSPGEAAGFERWTALEAQRPMRTSVTSQPDDARSFAADGGDAISLGDEPTLQDYIGYALARNPGLEARFHEWKAALERIPQARALPDPRVSYGYFVRASMTQQTVGLSQVFPWYEKLRARADAATEAAQAAEQRFERERLMLIAEVKEAYAEYAYLRQALDVMAENEAILESLRAGAEARVEAGDAPLADLVRAELAVEQIGDEIATLESRRGPLVAQLNAAMGRPSDAALPWPAPPEQPVVETQEQQLLDWLAERNPELRALRHETAQRREQLRLARQNRIPDLMLGVEYMDMVTMEDQVALMGSVNLPIWGERIDAERAEALAEFGASQQRRIERENRLSSQLTLAYYRFEDAQRRAELFEQRLIPTAREALDAAEAAYASGQAPFEIVMQAQTDVQDLELTLQRALADRFTQLARIERLVGRQLESDDAAEADAGEGPQQQE